MKDAWYAYGAIALLSVLLSMLVLVINIVVNRFTERQWNTRSNTLAFMKVGAALIILGIAVSFLSDIAGA